MWFDFDCETGTIYLSRETVDDWTDALNHADEKVQAVKLLLMKVAAAERILFDPNGCFEVWYNATRKVWGFRQDDQGEPLSWPLHDYRH